MGSIPLLPSLLLGCLVTCVSAQLDCGSLRSELGCLSSGLGVCSVLSTEKGAEMFVALFGACVALFRGHACPVGTSPRNRLEGSGQCS